MKPPSSDQHEQAATGSVPCKQWQFSILDAMYANWHPNAAYQLHDGLEYLVDPFDDTTIANQLFLFCAFPGIILVPVFALTVCVYICRTEAPRLLFLYPAGVLIGLFLLLASYASNSLAILTITPYCLPFMLGGSITALIDTIVHGKGRWAQVMCGVAILGVVFLAAWLIFLAGFRHT